MRPILIVSGVLGGGTALVFAAAGLVATLFPNGTLVNASPWNNGAVFAKGGVAMPMPAPMPVIVDDGTGSGGFTIPAPPNAGAANGGDIVVTVPGPTD